MSRSQKRAALETDVDEATLGLGVTASDILLAVRAEDIESASARQETAWERVSQRLHLLETGKLPRSPLESPPEQQETACWVLEQVLPKELIPSALKGEPSGKPPGAGQFW